MEFVAYGRIHCFKSFRSCVTFIKFEFIKFEIIFCKILIKWKSILTIAIDKLKDLSRKILSLIHIHRNSRAILSLNVASGTLKYILKRNHVSTVLSTISFFHRGKHLNPLNELFFLLLSFSNKSFYRFFRPWTNEKFIQRLILNRPVAFLIFRNFRANPSPRDPIVKLVYNFLALKLYLTVSPFSSSSHPS